VDPQRQGHPVDAVGDLGDLDAGHPRFGDPESLRHPGQSRTCDTERSSSGVAVPKPKNSR
jgi:hypothetical protein